MVLTLTEVLPATGSNDTAITDGAVRLSWNEYADAIARLAGRLRDAGVEPGDRVGVHLRKSVWSFVAVHAVLRAGGVMVPLDPLAPIEHTASVAEDAGLLALLTDADGAKAERLGEVVASVITDATGVAADHEPIEPVAVRPEDPAYIIYTSGSTGHPKGIVHSHASALAYARTAAEAYGLGPSDRLANVASLHFDQSTFELYAAPLAHAAVVVVPEPVLRFPASVAELVERTAVTVWYSVPYILRQLVDRGGLDDRDLSSLRWILYGGESYPPGELRALMAAIPSARVSNVYGPAEVNQCTIFNLDEPPAGDEAVPIGVAWPGAELVLVDGNLAPIDGVGVVGELLVAADTMMDRYWKRPDLTADAIVEHSFDGYGGRRWYRTGDLVEHTPDGQLVFLGRADHQVKIRGNRIEIEAVELTFLDAPGVAQVAVVVVDDDGPARLVAVVEGTADGRELSRFVAARLAGAAVPSEIIVIGQDDVLPRTATAKVDRTKVRRQLAELRTHQRKHPQ